MKLRYTKLLALCFISALLDLVSGQQYVHQRGDNYHAAVMIHRQPEHPRRMVRLRRQVSSHYQYQPWRQGDRISLEDVIQNFVKELLSSRKTSSEIEEEKRKENEENLIEYNLAKAEQQAESQAEPLPPTQQSPQSGRRVYRRKREQPFRS